MSLINLNIVASVECLTLQLLKTLFLRLNSQKKMGFVEVVQPEQVKPIHFFNRTFLFLRSANDQSVALAKQLQAAGHPFTYFIDEDFWNIPPNSPLYIPFNHPDIKLNLVYFMTESSQVLTTSPYLGQVLRKRFNRAIVVLPNFFDFDQLPFVQLPPAPPAEPVIRIGFSGTLREIEFEQLLLPALQQLHSQYGNRVTFHYLGATSAILDRFNTLFNPDNRFKTSLGSMDYGEYIKRQTLQNWHIAVSPLLDTSFARCKTDNKFREYAACGIPAIYSKVSPYRDFVTHNHTGLLVDNTVEAWVNGLSRLIEDPQLRDNLRQQGFNRVKHCYHINTVGQAWLNTLNQLRTPRSRYFNHLLTDGSRHLIQQVWGWPLKILKQLRRTGKKFSGYLLTDIVK